MAQAGGWIVTSFALGIVWVFPDELSADRERNMLSFLWYMKADSLICCSLNLRLVSKLNSDCGEPYGMFYVIKAAEN